ncbi:MAG: 2-hydroxychromene-2-carboxylate isomerase [Burkholderiales bacterium]
MATPIEFYFDFTSPYGYLASERIEALAAKFNRDVNWHAILLGAIFKEIGTVPLMNIPLKGDYSKHDMARSARLMSIPFSLPTDFPKATVAAARGFYWIRKQDPAQAKAFAQQVFRAYFNEDRDITSPEVIIAIANHVGIDANVFSAALQDSTVKEKLKTANDQAIARGVFGSPFFFVDNEPFWGTDRLPQIQRWLEIGGF